MRVTFLLITIIIFPLIPLNGSKNLPIVYLTDDIKTAAYYTSSLNGSYRLVLSDNMTETEQRLKRINISTKKVIMKKDIHIEGLDSRELAYLLVYLHEINRPEILYNESKIRYILSRLNYIVKNITSKESSYAVLFFSSDGIQYAILAAYAAILKNARMIDMDSKEINPKMLKGADYLIMITEPLTSVNYRRYDKVLKLALSIDEDPYLDASLGVITGVTIDTPFILLLGSTFTSFISRKVVRGISLEDDLPLARKIEYISSFYGYNSRIVHPNVRYSNVTPEVALSILNEAAGGIIYLNLHGNPYVMALKSNGYPIITSALIRRAEIDGSMTITLSCDTLRFSELEDPGGSVAYSMLQAGAFAYIGSRKVEFSISSEAGTSYPDLLLLMLMNGYSIGEAVKTVNNFHIMKFQKEGIKNTEAAYEIVLGDPSLRLKSNPVLPYRVQRVTSKKYEVHVLDTIPTIYIRLMNLQGNVKDIYVKSKLPSTYYVWYADDRGAFVYISTLSSSYGGYFPKESSILIEIVTNQWYIDLISYVAILLIIAVSLGMMLYSRKDHE